MGKEVRKFALNPINFCFLLFFVGRAWSEEPGTSAAREHFAEENNIQSTSGNVETTIKFINKSKQTITIHWLDYEGKRAF